MRGACFDLRIELHVNTRTARFVCDGPRYGLSSKCASSKTGGRNSFDVYALSEETRCANCTNRPNECWKPCNGKRGYCAACDGSPPGCDSPSSFVLGGGLALTIIIITIGARKLRHHASDTAYFEAPWFLRIDRSLPLDLVRANITGLGETSPNPLAGSLGTRGACCRKGDKNDPPECARASFAYSGYHECVLPRVMGNSLGC